MNKTFIYTCCLIFTLTSVALSAPEVEKTPDSAQPEQSIQQPQKPDKKGIQPKNQNGKNNMSPKGKRNGQGKNKPEQVNVSQFKKENMGRNHFHNMDFLKKNDPERFKLLSADAEYDHKIKDLVRQYKNAKNDKQKETIRTKVAELCAKHFQVRQQRRELELKRMKAWLQQMEEGVKKSRTNSDKIIEQRVKSLLDDNLGEF